MTLREYVEMLRRRWRLIVGGIVVGLVGGTALFVVTPQAYSAHATIFISAQSGTEDASAAYEGNLLSAQRMGSYLELLRSHRMAADVVGVLGLPMRPEELAERVTATTAPETVLLTVAVSDPSATRSAQIANAIADRFVGFLAELEQPADPTIAPVLGARVFEAAVPPMEPATPLLWVHVGVGLALGLLIGLIAAALRQSLDRSMISADGVAAALSAPVLATVPAASKGRSVVPAVRAEPLSLSAEAFRRLRTHLQRQGVGTDQRVIITVSPFDDPSQARAICELAAAVAEVSPRVLVIEADLVQPRIAAALGLSGAPGLAAVVSGRLEVPEAVQTWPDGGVDVLQAGSAAEGSNRPLPASALSGVLDVVRAQYDLVLVIAPPALTYVDGAAMAGCGDGTLVIVPHGKVTGRALEALASGLDATGARVLGAVLTGAPHRGVAGGWSRLADREGLSADAGPTWTVPVRNGTKGTNGTAFRPSPRPRPAARTAREGRP